MKFRIAVLLGASLLLSGCSLPNFSDVEDYLGFPSGDVNAGSFAQQGQATQATAQAEPPSAFCRGVATQDATSSAFDAATQQRVAQKSYAQCVEIFGAE